MKFFSPIYEDVLRGRHLRASTVKLVRLVFLEGPNCPSGGRFEGFRSGGEFVLIGTDLFSASRVTGLIAGVGRLLTVGHFASRRCRTDVFLGRLSIRGLNNGRRFLSFFACLVLRAFNLMISSRNNFITREGGISIASRLLRVLGRENGPVETRRVESVFREEYPTCHRLAIGAVHICLGGVRKMGSIKLSNCCKLTS